MKVRPLFIATQAPGDVYYRMEMFRKDGVLWPTGTLKMLPNWEQILESNDELLGEIERAISKANIVIWQRLSTLKGMATFLAMKEHWHMKKMILEIDDDVFHVDSANPGSAVIKPGSDAEKMFKKQLEVSDAVFVSTEVLRDLYKTKTKKPIHVIKNCVDFKIWDSLRKKKHNNIVIGWQGGPHHDEDLSILMPVIPKLLKKYKNIEFVFFGHRPAWARIDGCSFVEPVLIGEYPKKLAEINPDIMVAPLMDNYLNRARSNLRALESGAIKAPMVATGNKALPYCEIIHNSNGGILANNTDEWVNGLSSLIEDKKARIEMGTKLYDHVKKNYNAADSNYYKVLASIQ